MTSPQPLAQFAFALNLLLMSLLMFEQIQPWILLLACIAIVARLLLALNIQKKPISSRMVNLVAVFSAITLAYFSVQASLLSSMVNLLVLAISLKLLAISKQRDIYQLFAAQTFLVATGFVFHQQSGFALIASLTVPISLIGLCAQQNRKQNVYAIAQKSFKLCLQALPLSAILFFVFPQIGPLWQMPTHQSAKTGLSESISPGQLAQLAQSAELVFRAEFNSQFPSPTQRYWRAMTLEYFDGETWSIAPARKRTPPYANTSLIADESVSYQVLTEPQPHRWLYALAYSQASSHDVANMADHTVIARQNLHSSFRYQAQWYSQLSNAPIDSKQTELLNRQLPRSGNPKTQQWVSQLRSTHAQDDDFIRAVFEWFQNQPFHYTLKPALMPSNPIDTFLFEQQAGFCGHYASSLAYVLRLADIPARVVTGYQGGEWSSSGEFMSVYQYDAHAWIEWYSVGRGWQRIDPTAWVAPERIEIGLQSTLGNESDFLDQRGFSFIKFRDIALLNQLRLWLADIDYQWSRWVLGYDYQRQQDILHRFLGKLNTVKIIGFGLFVLTIIALLIAIYFRKSWWRKSPPSAEKYYHNACKLLAKRYFPRQAHWGATTYQQRLKKYLPADIDQQFSSLTKLYEWHHYDQREVTSDQFKSAFQQLAKALSEHTKTNSKGSKKR